MDQKSHKAIQDFAAVSAALEEILRPYEKDLVLTSSPPNLYSLNTRHRMPNQQVLFFASYQPRKGYVS